MLRQRNLTCVSRADGGDAVCELNGSFHERDLSEKLQTIHVKVSLRQAQLRKLSPRKIALIGEIVDSKNSQGLVTARLGKGMTIGRSQTSMPVMTVNDIRYPMRIKSLTQRGGGPAQCSKPQGVVAPVFAVWADIRIASALIEVWRQDEVDG